MRKTIAKLFAKLFGYTYLERFDCLLTKRIENNKRYKEGKEFVRKYTLQHPKCFFSEHFDEYVELFALLRSMENLPYLSESGDDSQVHTLPNGEELEKKVIPIKLVTRGQLEIMREVGFREL